MVRPIFPSRFRLVAAMNPCPCGYHGSRDEHRCACDSTAVARYLRRVSGPLLDRIDLHVDVPAVTWEELTGERRGEPSRVVRERVTEARARAARRRGSPWSAPSKTREEADVRFRPPRASGN